MLLRKEKRMSNKEFQRETKEDKPVIALCYDFDKTLSPDDMQAQGFIQDIGFEIGDFWNKSNGFASENDMDQNLAYMFTMKNEADGKVLFTKDNLAKYGSKVKLFPGVEEWFERIKGYGEEKGVIIEHYIISSGLKEMIEGTPIAQNGAFTKIFATSFYCNEKGVAIWPAQVVNYTNKTQFLFRISKGVLDVSDQGVNDYFNPEDIRIPFHNMIYIGDSDTDIPCMKLVNTKGGYSIGVYNPDTNKKNKVFQMMKDNRIGYFTPADYSEDGELDKIVKLIIDRTVFNDQLEHKHFYYKNEALEQSRNQNDEQRKINLIDDLEYSGNFSDTHRIIKNLSKYKEWKDEEIEKLLFIGINNSQVNRILTDEDIKVFYRKILEKTSLNNEYSKKIANIIN